MAQDTQKVQGAGPPNSQDLDPIKNPLEHARAIHHLFKSHTGES